MTEKKNLYLGQDEGRHIGIGRYWRGEEKIVDLQQRNSFDSDASPCSTGTKRCKLYFEKYVCISNHTFHSHPMPADFWLKTDTYHEQPEVTYTKELLLLAEGLRGGEAFSASFSTIAGVNGLNHANLRAAAVKVSGCCVS